MWGRKNEIHNLRQTRRDLRGDMNFVGQHYYQVNRILLEILGLWPYNNSIFIRIYRVSMLTVFVSSSITQFAKLHDTISDLDRFLYNLTYAVPSLIYILRFVTYITSGKQLRQLLDRIQHDWNTFKDGEERKIIRCSAITGMQCTIFAYVVTFIPLFGYIVTLYIPTFLDFVRPLNESRPRKLPILSEYFFLDEQEYYYPMLVHHSMVIGIGITLVISTEAMLMVFIQHGCGLFEVISYRLKHAFDEHETSCMPNMSDREKYSMIHSKITEAVIIHKRAIEFLDRFKLAFNSSYSIMLILGIVTITINMYRLLRALEMMNDWEELMASGIFVLGQYGYLFGVNYFGQKLNNYSIRMFNMTYEAFWYTAPIQAQKILIFILQKMMKGYALNISNIGIIIASLETFASVTIYFLQFQTNN
ncbi:uncharacterized protein LOC116845927 [Odontomachus brunneus]|uniref:uncharacterized protein LOC116845927 n=1 Tax=Odontomachus brunneus TaxID=486640 RepID=UPI0013F1C7D6|nr:uncharacterized protein LOC116845927 [Odontomachus brunneus]